MGKKIIYTAIIIAFGVLAAYCFYLAGFVDLQFWIKDRISKQIPPATYLFLLLGNLVYTVRIVLILLVVILVVLLFLFLKYKQQIFYAISIFISDIKQTCTLAYLPKQHSIIVALAFAFVFIHALYYSSTWYLTHDECWSYNYFIHPSIINSIALPYNNHFGYTFLAAILDTVCTPIVAIRSIAIIATLLAVLIFAKLSFTTIRANFIWCMAIFIASVPLLAYSALGRGYSLSILFTVIQLYTFFQLLKKNNLKYYIYFGVAIVFAIYSNVFMAYTAAAWLILGFYFLKNKKAVLLVSIFTIVIIGALLYTPIVLLKGNKLYNTGYTGGLNLQYSIMHCANTISYYFTGIKNIGWWYIIIIGLSTLYAFVKKNTLYTICVLQVIVPFIVFSIQPQLQYERLYTYLIVFITPIVAILLTDFYKLLKIYHTNVYIVSSIVYIIGSAIIFNKHTLFTWSKQLDKASYHTAQYLLANKIDSIYTFTFYPSPIIELVYTQNNKSIVQLKPEITSIQYAPFDSTIKYQAIITKLEDSMRFTNYTPTIIDSCIIVWQ